MVKKQLVHFNQKIGLILVYSVSATAIAVAIFQIITAANNLAVYNLLRSLAFAFVCVYFYLNPTKINFTGAIGTQRNEGSIDKNIKIAYFLSYLFSAFNNEIYLVFGSRI